MNIDLDRIFSTVKPWDLSLTIDGVEHRVRRLTAPDVKRLHDVPRHPDDANRQFALSLFDGGPPEGSNNWDSERIGTVLLAVTAYYTQAVLGKNAELVARAVANQIPTTAARMTGSGA